MNIAEKSVDFICLNYAEDFKKGVLKLPLPFYVEYGEYLPGDLVLHSPSNEVWPCKYQKGCTRIDGLEKWMDYYNVNPYNLVRLYYLGGPDFRFEIFGQYAVEMNSVEVISDCGSKKCVYEVDKLCSQFLFNAFRNCVGKSQTTIEPIHLVEESYKQILSSEACNQLQLDSSFTSIQLGFEEHQWNVSLKWVNNEVFFGREWLEFVNSAAISVGDVIILQKTHFRSFFKVAVFDRRIVAEAEQSVGFPGAKLYSNFFKGFTHKALEVGELEIPFIFRKKFGHTLGPILQLHFGVNYKIEAGYCSSTGKMNGLLSFLKKFHVEENYFLFFNYNGNSEFSVSVYDSQCMNHLRDTYGYLTIEDFEVVDLSGSEDGTNPDRPGDGVIEISDQSKSMDSESEDQTGHGVIEISDQSESMDSESEDSSGEDEVEEDFAFNVVLKRSHVDQRSHGVYIPPPFWTRARQWDIRTNVALIVGDDAWYVDILRRGNQARFSHGWNNFVTGNHLQSGRRLFFHYVGNFQFEVRFIN